MRNANNSQIKELQFRLGNNDQNALKDLFDHFSKRLFHFAYTIIHSREFAEEIVEDVFIQVWLKRIKLSTLENLTWYMYVTTKNISCNYLRKYNKINHIDVDELTLPYYKVDATPEELMISHETLKKVNKIINDLPPKCRIIFKLIKEDGLKYKEVAGLLNLSSKTVENQMGIALKKLHAAIDHLFFLPKK